MTPSRAARAYVGVLALALVALLGVAAEPAPGASPTAHRQAVGARLAATEKAIAATREREHALQAAISAQSDRIAGAQRRADRLEAEVWRLEVRLSTAQAAVRATEDRLVRLRADLVFLRRQLRIAAERLDRRVVDTYTSDQPSALEVVVGASNFGDAMDRLEFNARLAHEDASLIRQVAVARRGVVRARSSAKALRRRQQTLELGVRRVFASRRAALGSVIAERERLSALRTERSRSLATIRVQRSDWEAEASALEAESARLAGIIRAAASRPPSPAASLPGAPGAAPGDLHRPTPDLAGPSSQGLIWPVRGTIVSPFGQRWGRLHAGIDIAAPAGTPIVAAAAGSVVFAGSLSGYGLIVVIQHPGGLATAYAHNSSLAVTTGQEVGQGQAIAAVGCTGHCFGDHLHFEVRVDGSPVDPLGHL